MRDSEHPSSVRGGTIRWYRTDWKPLHAIKEFGLTLLATSWKVVPFIVASFFASPLVVVGAVVFYLALGVGMTYWRLTTAREHSPIGIGFDDDHVYLDRSLFTPGTTIERVALSDIRRVIINHRTETKKLKGKKKASSWNLALYGRPSLFSIEYQDRKGKFLYRPLSIPPTMDDVAGIIERIQRLQSVELRIGQYPVDRATFRDACGRVMEDPIGDDVWLKLQSILDNPM